MDYLLIQLTSELILDYEAQAVLCFSRACCLIAFSLRRESNCRFNENSYRIFRGFGDDFSEAFWHSITFLARIEMNSAFSSKVSSSLYESPLSNDARLLRGSSINLLIIKQY